MLNTVFEKEKEVWMLQMFQLEEKGNNVLSKMFWSAL